MKPVIQVDEKTGKATVRGGKKLRLLFGFDVRRGVIEVKDKNESTEIPLAELVQLWQKGSNG